MINVKLKALSLLIKSFLETSLNPKFQHNQYHEALYKWHVEGRRDIVCPVQPPYYENSFFVTIKQVKQEGILNLNAMTVCMCYRWLE